ncbi:hypothetical protein HPB51_024400 [Rhipicephalus microplus]|uniref:Uncharacterized protein n=1 Tax=Rhipicephalus microplus TaxID=6941 RepID=A0A9J6EK24_RHIMP|nr:hypothetical protein HPB51_024400 [Rhipicephalus microplus]
MMKTPAIFSEHFARLGMFSKVQAPAGGRTTLSAEISLDEATAPTVVEALQEGNFQAGLNQHATALEVSREIKVGRLYHWLNWSLVRSHHCLYLWSSAAAIELPHISSGSFNFLVNNTFHVLLPTGEVENASGSSNQGMELLRRLQEAQSLVS